LMMNIERSIPVVTVNIIIMRFHVKKIMHGPIFGEIYIFELFL